MATSAQGWEFVGKTSKKKGQGLSKSQKKAYLDNMPRIIPADPVKESSTMFDAFKEKEKATAMNGNSTATKKPQQQSKKKGGHTEKKEILTLDQAVAKLEKSEMETILTKVQTTFPDNPSVWLKDLASWINLKLESVEEKDPVFASQAADYPACKLPKSVKSLLMSTLNQCTMQTMELFHEHCINSMITDMGKGLSTYGYRIFIQLMAQLKPNIPVAHLSKYLDLMNTVKNRPLRCLSVMWALGQSGLFDIKCGLKIWLGAMLPMLGIRSLSGYAVEYLEKLLSTHQDLQPAYNVLSFRDFFPILDVVFSPNPSLSGNHQKKLLSLYPKLRIIAFGSNPESSLRNFFPSFLARLGVSSSKALQEELLSCLVTCLSRDKQCYSVWRQMYTKHLKQSSILLAYLLANWQTVSRQLEIKMLKETIRAFNITNEEMSAQGRDAEGYEACTLVCKELLLKMNSAGFPWLLLIFGLFALVAGFIAFDMYCSKGFKNSKTARVLEDTGMLVFAEQVWSRMQLYAGKLWVWLQENVPLYWAKVCEVCGPWMQYTWTQMKVFWQTLVEATKTQREWLGEKIPELLLWVDSKVPWLWPGIQHWSWQVWLGLCWVWEQLLIVLQPLGVWLRENIFTGKLSPENLWEMLSNASSAVQSYASSLLNWLVTAWAAKAN